MTVIPCSVPAAVPTTEGPGAFGAAAAGADASAAAGFAALVAGLLGTTADPAGPAGPAVPVVAVATAPASAPATESPALPGTVPTTGPTTEPTTRQTTEPTAGPVIAPVAEMPAEKPAQRPAEEPAGPTDEQPDEQATPPQVGDPAALALAATLALTRSGLPTAAPVSPVAPGAPAKTAPTTADAATGTTASQATEEPTPRGERGAVRLDDVRPGLHLGWSAHPGRHLGHVERPADLGTTAPTTPAAPAPPVTTSPAPAVEATVATAAETTEPAAVTTVTAPQAGQPIQTATTTPVAQAAPHASPVADAVTGQVHGKVVAEVIRLVSTGGGSHRMTLRLDPGTLGEVRIVLAVRGDSVRVRLAAHDQAHDALVAAAPELRRLLEGQPGVEARVLVRELATAAAPVAAGTPSDARDAALTGQGAGPGTTDSGSGQPHRGTESRQQGPWAGTPAAPFARDGIRETALAPSPGDRLTSRPGLDVSV